MTDAFHDLATGVSARIDAHHHVWDLSVRDQPWTAESPALRRDFTLDELLPQFLASGVRGGVLVQTVASADETPEMLALAESAAEVVGVVGWVDLAAADVADRLSALSQCPGGSWLVGVRHQVQAEHDPSWLLRPEVLRGLRAVAEAGLAYDLVVRSDQIEMSDLAARQLPELHFVLDHGGKPPIAAGGLDPWRKQVSELALRENVAVKLSGLLTEAGADAGAETLRPYSDHLLDAFGTRRTMFGSDWPVSTLRADYSHVVSMTAALLSELSQQEQAEVFGATAAAWYGLQVAQPHRAGR